MIRRGTLLAASLCLAGCTSMLPDRTTSTRLEIDPGETLRAEVSATGGERTLVAFSSVDGHELQIAFEGGGILAEPHGLGYAHQWIESTHRCLVTLTNESDDVAEFLCHVKGPGDVGIVWTRGSSTSATPDPTSTLPLLGSIAILDPLLH